VTGAQRVELYTAPFCANCDRARELLERVGVAFAEIDLSRDLERCCELEALTGGRSTPQIVIDGRPVGGYAELAALDRTGGLRAFARGGGSGAAPVRGSTDGAPPAVAHDPTMNGLVA
jgi:glutaredoxin 3